MKSCSIIIIAFSCLPSLCMEPRRCTDIVIKTSDKQGYTMPLWQVRESNTLYTYFLKKAEKHPQVQPRTIHTPTLSLEEIELYSTALHQEDFNDFYHTTLTPEQQRTLIIASGEHTHDENEQLIPKLNDVTLSTKLLCLHLDNAVIQKHIFTYFSPKGSFDTPIMCIINHCKRAAIIDNALHKNYTQKNDDGPIVWCPSRDGSHYNTLPPKLIYKGTSNFHGFSFHSQYTFSDGNTYTIEQYNNKNDIFFFVTPSHPINMQDELNIRKLWLYNPVTKEQTLLKQIQHEDKINEIVFSKNGKYLAIKSTDTHDNSNISLTCLEIENDALIKPNDIYLPKRPYLPRTFCFNSQSTLATAEKNNLVTFWDTESGNSLNTMQCPGDQICDMCFNSDESRLAVAIDDFNYDNETNTYTPSKTVVVLYDADNNFIPINTIDCGTPSSLSLDFNSSHDTLLATTDTQAFIFNGWSGEKIMETKKIMLEQPTEGFQLILATLAPEIDILATALSTNSNICNTQLWDARSGTLLATLLENEEHISGVGITPNCRSIITKYLDNDTIETQLCDTTIYDIADLLLKKLDLFQLYCLHRIDRENQCQKPEVRIHYKSLLYQGIAQLPQEIKDAMYKIFHILKVYGNNE